MNQTKIPVQTQQFPHPLESTHLTTLNFFQPLIAYYQPLIENSKITVNCGSLVRAIAMQRPAYADIKLRLRAFFVPYYTVFEAFESFLTGSPYKGVTVSETPSVTIHTLLMYMIKHLKVDTTIFTQEDKKNVLLHVSGGDGYVDRSWQLDSLAHIRELEKKYDVVWVDMANSSSNAAPVIRYCYGKLDYIGRAYLKLLRSLGCNNPWSAIFNLDSDALIWFYRNVVGESIPQGGTSAFYNRLKMAFYIQFVSNSSLSIHWETNASWNMPEGDKRWTRLSNSRKVTALPFYCVARIWLDWYISNQYVSYQNVIEWFIKSSNASYFEETIDIILNSFYNGSTDIYINAWDNPVSPNDASVSNNFSVTDVTSNVENGTYRSQVKINYSGNVGNSPTNGTPYVQSEGTSVSPVNFTQFIDTALHKLTDWVQRKKLSGSKTIDRYKNEFDQTLSSEQLRRAYEIGHYDVSLNINEIMSQADTFNPETGMGMKNGDYTGKMEGGTNLNACSFDFDTNQVYGAFIIVATILPRIEYYQGFSPIWNQLSVQKFWHPDLDGLAPEAIAKEEFYNDFKLSDFFEMPQNIADGYSSFGFTGSFHIDKSRQSVISGDFSLASRNVGYDAWHTFRDVNPLMLRENWADYTEDEQKQLLKHSPLTISTKYDLQQYNRLFAETDLDANDGFVCVFHFNAQIWNAAKPLFDTYDWYDEDCKKIDATINGTQVF